MRRVAVFFAVGMFLVSFAAVASADEVSVGASVSYGMDLNDPARGSGNSSVYSGMNANDESFGVDPVQVGVSGSRGDVSYAAAINFGDLASAADDTDSGDSAQLSIANIAYDAGGVTVTAGRFGTPIGYEVLEPWGNAHVSRSYGWQAQPINHDGVTVSTAVGGADVTLGAVNNFTVADGSNDADDEMGLIGAIGTSLGDWSVNLSGIVTEESDTTDITMANLILSGELAGMPLTVAVNYRENDATTKTEMNGVAIYTGTSVGSADLDLRLDFIDDEGITTGGTDTEVWAVTATASWALSDGVDFRLEYRHDDADDAIFSDDSSGGTDDALDTVQAQLVWNP